MDKDFLTEAFCQLRKDAAAGIDEMTVTEYAVNLGERIADLHRRMVAREYRAQPARRVWIPKGDGGQRPLAILVLEDKIVQRAVAMLLEAIYEPHFCEFSFGFRRQRSAHQALTYLRQQCLEHDINWVIDADIAKFFDTISWEELRTILQKRVTSPRRGYPETDWDVAARGRGGGGPSHQPGNGHSARGTDLTNPSKYLSAHRAG